MKHLRDVYNIDLPINVDMKDKRFGRKPGQHAAVARLNATASTITLRH